MSRRRSALPPARPSPGAVRAGAAGRIPAILVALLVVVALGVWPAAVAADDRPTLKIDPATQSVAPGQTFVVNVVQSAAVNTTGAQTNVVFDPKLLQLRDFELGPAYASANAIFQYGIADLGTSGDKDKELARANTFGTLENVAGFLLPGSGAVPPGDTVFLKMTFVAQPGSGGRVTLGLLAASMLDEQGGALDPHILNGAVVVGAGAAPSGSQTAGPSPSGAPGASMTASPGASPLSSVAPETPAPLTNPTTPVRLAVAPTTLTLEAGDAARVFLIANADGNISSAASDLSFDKDKLEITGVELTGDWADATAIAVTTDKTKRGLDAAIAEANTTGVLQQVGAFFAPGAQQLPYGEDVFASVLVRAKTAATTALSIDNAAVLGVSGETLPVQVEPGSLSKPPEKPIQLDPTLVIPLALLAIVTVGGVVLWRSGRIPVRVRRRWPYYVSLALGLIPVTLFVGLVALIVAQAAPVVTDPGIGALFGGQFLDPKGNLSTGYALLPPIWGTVLVTGIAVAIGLPISLALAVIAVDFPMGPIGRLVRPMVSVFSGIPPVVYAVSVPLFVTAFMIPKFAANMTYDQFTAGGPAAIGADPSTWPPPGVPYSPGAFPWTPTEANSVLLGGLLVGLFLIPFVTPIFVDALANVPRAAREASLALGANRTYTLRRVVLPRALPAIAGAGTLAMLKAMGDSVIVLFAVGFAAGFPTPPFDVLERSAPLGAWGANLIGSFDTLSATCNPQACAVGYTSALLLLVIAGVAVVALTWLQARARRRVAV